MCMHKHIYICSIPAVMCTELHSLTCALAYMPHMCYRMNIMVYTCMSMKKFWNSRNKITYLCIHKHTYIYMWHSHSVVYRSTFPYMCIFMYLLNCVQKYIPLYMHLHVPYSIVYMKVNFLYFAE